MIGPPPPESAQEAQRWHEWVWAAPDRIERHSRAQRLTAQLRLLNLAERWELRMDGHWRVVELVPLGRAWGGE